MNHRYYWSLIALAASFVAEAQGYLESERWKGWVQPATEVYYDEVDRRMLLVDRQLDYVQFRYSPPGGGLKPTLVTRVPLSQLGTAKVIGFSRGEVVLDSASV